MPRQIKSKNKNTTWFSKPQQKAPIIHLSNLHIKLNLPLTGMIASKRSQNVKA